MAGLFTAEDALETLRAKLVQKVALAETILKPLYPNATPEQQILMMGPLDEAQEAERLLGALAIARAHLAQRSEPRRDPPLRRGR